MKPNFVKPQAKSKSLKALSTSSAARSPVSISSVEERVIEECAVDSKSTPLAEIEQSFEEYDDMSNDDGDQEWEERQFKSGMSSQRAVLTRSSPTGGARTLSASLLNLKNEISDMALQISRLEDEMSRMSVPLDEIVTFFDEFAAMKLVPSSDSIEKLLFYSRTLKIDDRILDPFLSHIFTASVIQDMSSFEAFRALGPSRLADILLEALPYLIIKVDDKFRLLRHSREFISSEKYEMYESILKETEDPLSSI